VAQTFKRRYADRLWRWSSGRGALPGRACER
jgi:hypothetical protein